MTNNGLKKCCRRKEGEGGKGEGNRTYNLNIGLKKRRAGRKENQGWREEREGRGQEWLQGERANNKSVTCTSG